MKVAGLGELELEYAIRNKNVVWQTKDGTIVPIREMSDSHLVNTINMLRRKEKEEKVFWENGLYGLTLDDIC